MSLDKFREGLSSLSLVENLRLVTVSAAASAALRLLLSAAYKEGLKFEIRFSVLIQPLVPT